MPASLTTPLCIPFQSDLPGRLEDLGGKGYRLLELSRRGLPIPDGFCITTAAFDQAVRETLRDAPSLDDIFERITHAHIPDAVEDAILSAFAELQTRGVESVAVRSSALDEDSAAQSGAGQQATVLGVRTPEALLDAVRHVWASLFSQGALLYRGRVRLDEAPPSTAVVVQALVEPDVAGVLFTIDPVDQDPDTMLVCSAYGVGETVVGGQAVDTFYLDRSGHITRSELGDKVEMRVATTAGGLETRPVEEPLRHAPSLEPDRLRALAELGRKLEHHFDRPQDIEFAFTPDGHLHLLQTRPVTGLRGQGGSSTGSDATVFSNINVGEALPGVGTPLTWSVIRAFTQRGFETAFGALGLDVPPHYDLVASFRGRVFLNISEFVSIASQIPLLTGQTLVRLGGATAPPELDDTTEKLSPFAFLARLPITIPRLIASQLSTPLIARNWARRFNTTRDTFFERDLTPLANTELLPVLDQLDAAFNRTGEVMLSTASNFLMSYVVVSEMLARVGGPEAARKEAVLFSGLTRVKSAAPGLELLGLARFIRDRPALRNAFEAAVRERPGRVTLSELEALPEGQVLAQRLRGFLERWGHRAPREAEIATPRWREDPSFLLTVLRHHLRAPHLPSPGEIEQDLLEQRREATQLIRQHFFTGVGVLFRALLRWAQTNARMREEQRAYVVETLSMYRHFFLEAGRRLDNQSLIAQIDDVFFLTYPEVRAWLEGRDNGARFRYRVAARRAAFRSYQDTPDPPEIFVHQPGQPQPTSSSTSAIPHDADVLRGLSGAPGRVTGPARVLHDLDALDIPIQPGEILITSFTDVGWTPLFLVAAGVVTDRGGPLSHSCVVAREYGIPCVVNTQAATEVIQTGDIITVDGDAGLVYRSSEDEWCDT